MLPELSHVLQKERERGRRENKGAANRRRQQQGWWWGCGVRGWGGGHVDRVVTGLRDTTLWASPSTTRGADCSVSAVLLPLRAQHHNLPTLSWFCCSASDCVFWCGLHCGEAQGIRMCASVSLSSTRAHLSSVGNSAVGGWRSGRGQGAAV